MPSFLDSFEDRIQAYKRAHELLALAQFTGVDLRALLLQETYPYREHNTITVHGPDVFLPARAALTIAMCIHEMVTNAVKHGALSVTGGRVAIVWRLVNRDLVLSWTETYGPPILVTPTRRGFGSQLIKIGVVGDLCGRFTLDFPATGFVGHLTIPWQSLEPRTRPSRAALCL